MGKHSYEGEGLTIHFDPKKCIHAGECVRGSAAVFNPNNKPWVKPDAAAVDEVVAVVERCPTGALTYERADGEAEAADARNTVHLSVDGPVYLRGDLHIEDATGQTHELTRAALCRCGASKNKPAYLYLLTSAGAEQKARVTMRFLRRKLQEYEELELEIAELKKEVNS